jgi:hypothetical protein
MPVILRRLRADVRTGERSQFSREKIESNAAVKRDTVVVVVDTRINPASDSGLNIERLAGVKGG